MATSLTGRLADHNQYEPLLSFQNSYLAALGYKHPFHENDRSIGKNQRIDHLKGGT
jgi:hypothetical protein